MSLDLPLITGSILVASIVLWSLPRLYRWFEGSVTRILTTDDFPNWWQQTPRASEIILAFLIGTALTVSATETAWQAWVSTPDVPDFRNYVDPSQHSTKPKADYLFGPLILALIPLVAFWSHAILPKRIADWLFPFSFQTQRRWELLSLVVWFGIIALVVRHHAMKAMNVPI